MEIARYLSEEIGPRQGGSDAEHRAADYLAQQFAALGLSVQRQSFRYIGWRPLGEPCVEVLSPVPTELEAAPMLYSESTPDEGVVGSVVPSGTAFVIPGVFEWPQYDVVNREGAPLARLIAHGDGPAIPFPNTMPLFLSPMVMIGQEDHRLLQAWLAGGPVTARVKSQGSYVPGYTSYNVIATIPGETDDVVVLCAHYDSAYRSPGADDNASGVEALFRAAGLLMAKRLRQTVRLIAFGAEEWPLFGSRFYVNRLKERGELHHVNSVLNLDMVGCGDQLWMYCAPEAMRAKVEETLNALGLAGAWPVRYDPPLGPSSDHWPFHEQGIPSAFFLFYPYPEYHRPNDTVKRLSEEKIAKIAHAAAYLVEHL